METSPSIPNYSLRLPKLDDRFTTLYSISLSDGEAVAIFGDITTVSFTILSGTGDFIYRNKSQGAPVIMPDLPTGYSKCVNFPNSNTVDKSHATIVVANPGSRVIVDVVGVFTVIPYTKLEILADMSIISNGKTYPSSSMYAAISVNVSNVSAAVLMGIITYTKPGSIDVRPVDITYDDLSTSGSTIVVGGTLGNSRYETMCILAIKNMTCDINIVANRSNTNVPAIIGIKGRFPIQTKDALFVGITSARHSYLKVSAVTDRLINEGAFNNIKFSKSALTVDEVDRILAIVSAASWSTAGTGKTIDLSDNSVPTNAAAKTDLTNKGWTVITD
jgi:hypothetical protein